jgi:hypothetical protein
MRWFGPISSECTPPVEDAFNRTRGGAENPVRAAFMLTALIEYGLFTMPNTRSPLTEAPNPQARQNAAPVIPIGVGK